MRVFELAKLVNRNVNEVKDELKQHAFEAKSNLSVVEPSLVEAVLTKFGVSATSGEAASPEPGARHSGPKAAPKHRQEEEKEKPSAFYQASKPILRGVSPAKPPAGLAETADPGAPAASSAAPAPAASGSPGVPDRPPIVLRASEPAPARIPMSPLEPGYRPPPKPAFASGTKPADGRTSSPSVSRPVPGAAPVISKPGIGSVASPTPSAKPGVRPAPRPGSGYMKSKESKEEKEKEKLLAKKAAPKAAAPPPPPPPAEGESQEKKVIRIPEMVTVSELAELMGMKAVDLIRKLMEYKLMATINQKLDKDVAQTLALDFGFETEIQGLYGEDLLEKAEAEKDDPKDLVPRPPVVTIMGHVDHGKTSLLDAIRSSNVVAGESGGITQHIGAYKVTLPGKGQVVFLDTPGHAAFTSMRARGAKVTDVVVLVVAADDGVKPQTLEAIDHARAAGVPIVVAINKIDKEGANPDRVMQELSKQNLMPEEWGGKTIYVQISAKKRLNLEKLLEMLLLEAELLELKANPGRPARGVIIEAKLDKGRGPVATVLVQGGTLKGGDIFVTGNYFGKVRALIDDHGSKIDQAGPSTPVEVLGLQGVPAAGDNFQVVEDERLARQISAKRLDAQKERDRRMKSHVKLDDLFDHIQEGELKELRIVIKADVAGSSEAIKESLEKIDSNKVKVKVIHAGVGHVNETDVMLAAASDAIILGFHVKAEGKAADLAKTEQVDARFYEVIYDLVNDVRSAMEGLLEPHYNEVVSGKGEVRGVFRVKGSMVAGTYITSGKVTRGGSARLLRNGEKIWEGKIGSLKRFKDDAKEVATGMECGIGLEGASDIQIGDALEFTMMEEVAQKL